MNNSKFAIENVLSNEETIDRKPILREKEGELMKIIDTIQKIEKTKEWSTLKEKIFDSLSEKLLKEIQSEARKENPDTLKLNRLAGQLIWSEKFSDLSKLENDFRVQLTNIRKLLYGKTEE